MKINWDTHFKDENGNKIVVHTKDGPTDQAVTLQSIIIQILNAFDKDEKITAEQKYTRYEIMKKAKQKSDIEIEDLAEIKKCCDLAITSPWLYGQIIDTINQKETTLKEVKGGN